MRRERFWKWWDTYSGFVIGAFLIVAGILIGLIHQAGVVRELSEALIIAGVLTITVDPFVKGKARREAIRDIFHHMLGFSLPLPIRDRLLTIVKETNLYRENTTMHCVVSEAGESLQFEIEMEYEIINPTQHTIVFEPLVQFEKGEHPVLKSVTCFGESEYGSDAALTPNSSQELNSLEYRGRQVKIPPGQKRRFKYEYTTQYPISLGYYFQNFQYPTIGLALTVKHPATLAITASPAEFQSVGEWRYTKLFMPQDHMDIRWEKRTKI
jgi:hypothetical protein